MRILIYPPSYFAHKPLGHHVFLLRSYLWLHDLLIPAEISFRSSYEAMIYEVDAVDTQNSAVVPA